MGHRRERSARATTASERFLQLLLALCIAMPATALAQPPRAPAAGADTTADASVRIVGGHTDNLLRASSSPESADYRALGLTFDVTRTGTRIDLSLRGDAERRRYSTPGIDDEPVGTVVGNFDIDMVPDRFFWTTTATWGLTRPNPFAPSSPQNRQVTRVLDTGPGVDLPMGQRMAFRASAIRSDRDFEATNQLSGTTDTYEAGVYRALSTTVEVGLGVSRDDVEYELLLAPQQVDSAYLSYERRLSTGSFSVRAGTSDLETTTQSSSSPLFDASWSKGIGTRSTIDIVLQHLLTDAVDQFAVGAGGGTGAPLPDDIVLSRSYYEASNLGVTVAFTFARSTLTVGAALNKSEYDVGQFLDNDRQSYSIAFLHDVNSRLVLGFSHARTDREFIQLFRTDEDRTSGLSLTRTFGRRLDLALSFDHYSRDGRNTAQPYDENSVRLAVSIDLNPPR